jgi:hypothetical protein
MALPRILHQNIIAQAASVVASSTAAGAAVANLSDGRPYTWWSPAAMNASIEVDAGVAVEADGLYIPAHTLDSTFCDVSVYAADLPFSGMQMLTAPEDFGSADWAKTNVTIVTNTITAPDASSTADLIKETTAVGVIHFVQHASVASIVGSKYTGSIFLKPSGRHRGYIDISDGVTGSAVAVYDLVAGTVSTQSSGSWTGVAASIYRDSNGFFRVSVTGIPGSGSVLLMAIALLDAAGNSTYTGDGASGVAAWGAMLHTGSSPAPYIPQGSGRWIGSTALAYSNRVMSPKNIITGSAIITPNSAMAPNGMKEASIVDDQSLSSLNGATLGSMAELHEGEGYQTAGVFVKKSKDDAHYACLYLARYGATPVEQYIVINTNTGALSAVFGSPLDKGIEDCGDYWWAWIQGSANSGAGNLHCDASFYPAWNYDGASAVSISTTGSKVIWGGKLEKTQGRPAPFREDAPLYLPFPTTTKRYWLIRLNRKTGAALPAIGELVLGKALTIPTGVTQGTDLLTRKVDGQRNANENGQPLGRTINFETRAISLKFERVTWQWLRGVWEQAWRRGLRSEPFGFVWDYEQAVEDVVLVTAADQYTAPHYSGKTADLNVTVSGVVT